MAAAGAQPTGRTVLPLPQPKYPPIKERNIRNAKAPPRFEVKAPPGAPNVVIVLIDDFGFAGTITFGGPVSPRFHHVIDVAPTVPEGGHRHAAAADGRRQHSISRCSATAPCTMTGGWRGPSTGRPGELQPRRALADDIWELYDTRGDFSLVDDVGAKHPQKLKELQALFIQEAVRNHGLPIDDRLIERTNAALAGQLGRRRRIIPTGRATRSRVASTCMWPAGRCG